MGSAFGVPLGLVVPSLCGFCLVLGFACSGVRWTRLRPHSWEEVLSGGQGTTRWAFRRTAASAFLACACARPLASASCDRGGPDVTTSERHGMHSVCTRRMDGDRWATPPAVRHAVLAGPRGHVRWGHLQCSVCLRLPRWLDRRAPPPAPFSTPWASPAPQWQSRVQRRAPMNGPTA